MQFIEMVNFAVVIFVASAALVTAPKTSVPDTLKKKVEERDRAKEQLKKAATRFKDELIEVISPYLDNGIPETEEDSAKIFQIIENLAQKYDPMPPEHRETSNNPFGGMVLETLHKFCKNEYLSPKWTKDPIEIKKRKMCDFIISWYAFHGESSSETGPSGNDNTN